jgi:hypothetical protein
MASLQRNVASQNLTFAMVSTTTGLGLAGLTITGFVAKDGGAQAGTAGTFTSLGNGQYNYAPTQAETNATDVGFLFTNASAITANIDFHTDNVTGTGANSLINTNTVNWNGQTIAGVPPDAYQLRNGTAQGGSATSITLDAGASATSNLYNGATVFIRSGTGAGQTQIITAYNGGTKVATTGTWATAPDATSVFTVAAFGPSQATVSGTVNANVTAINSVPTTPVTTVSAVIGTSLPIQFTGTTPNAFVQTDIKSINNVAASGVTTVNAVQGTTVNPLFTGSFMQTDVQDWKGTAVLTPATAGIPEVDVHGINNIATSSVTTVNANQGTTAPITFTGGRVDANVTGTNPAVNVTQWLGNAVGAAATGVPDVNVKNINNVSGSGITTVNAVQGTTANPLFTGQLIQSDARDWNGTPMVGAVPPDAIFLRNGTAQGGSSTSITLDAGASATTNYYNGASVFIRSGTGAGQTQIITSYNGATKVATTGSWATAPDATSVFSVAAFGPSQATVSGTVSANVIQWQGTNVPAPATTGIPDVNAKNIGNVGVPANPVIGINIGTTQPINFTGVGAGALVNSTVSGTPGVNVTQINGVTLAAQALAQSTQTIAWGTVGAGSSTTNVNVATLNNPASLAATGQLVGRTIIFPGNTSTGGMQAQASGITGSTTGGTPALAVTALTTTPAIGDTFVII